MCDVVCLFLVRRRRCCFGRSWKVEREMLDALEGEQMEEDLPTPGGDNGMVQHEDEFHPRTDEWDSNFHCPVPQAPSTIIYPSI